MWKEFREFAMRGNVIDLAVGLIVGAAFGKIVTSLVLKSDARRTAAASRPAASGRTRMVVAPSN